jgi:hypothetical protein
VTQSVIVVTCPRKIILVIFTDMHTCRHFAYLCEARPCGCYTAEWRVSHAGTTKMLVGLILERGALKRNWPYEHGLADAKDMFQCPSKDVGTFLWHFPVALSCRRLMVQCLAMSAVCLFPQSPSSGATGYAVFHGDLLVFVHGHLKGLPRQPMERGVCVSRGDWCLPSSVSSA